jgi:hypothetical protein
MFAPPISNALHFSNSPCRGANLHQSKSSCFHSASGAPVARELDFVCSREMGYLACARQQAFIAFAHGKARYQALSPRRQRDGISTFIRFSSKMPRLLCKRQRIATARQQAVLPDRPFDFGLLPNHLCASMQIDMEARQVRALRLNAASRVQMAHCRMVTTPHPRDTTHATHTPRTLQEMKG